MLPIPDLYSQVYPSNLILEAAEQHTLWQSNYSTCIPIWSNILKAPAFLGRPSTLSYFDNQPSSALV